MATRPDSRTEGLGRQEPPTNPPGDTTQSELHPDDEVDLAQLDFKCGRCGCYLGRSARRVSAGRSEYLQVAKPRHCGDKDHATPIHTVVVVPHRAADPTSTTGSARKDAAETPSPVDLRLLGLRCGLCDAEMHLVGQEDLEELDLVELHYRCQQSTCQGHTETVVVAPQGSRVP